MSIAMVAMLAFGGTYAYFTATTNAVTKDVKTGTVMLVSGASFEAVTTVVPTQVIANEISYTNKSDVAVYVFVTLSYQLKSGSKSLPQGATVDQMLTVTLAKTEGTANFTKLDGEEGVYWYKTTAGATNTTAGDPIAFASIAIANLESESKEDAAGEWMGIEITFSLHAESIQAYDFADEDAAYTALQAQPSTAK